MTNAIRAAAQDFMQGLSGYIAEPMRSEYALELEDIIQRCVDEANAWQPIETAPKDGSSILLFCEGNIFTGKRHKDEIPPYKDWWFCAGVGERAPTHWMPLPTPPKESKNDE